MDETTQTIISQTPLSRQAGDSVYDGCLVIISGRDLGRNYSVKDEQVMIGRSPKSAILIDDDSVSRDHAVVWRDQQGYWVEDMQSKNGCYLNDERVKRAPLNDGDFLRIGKTIFKFLSTDNVENAYHEELFKLSTMDGLTLLFNRRYFTESMEREWDRVKRYQRSLSLMMIDIDHFKDINDRYGHRAGDHVLKRLATIMRGRARKVDYVARYGGEEFAIIMPEVDLPGAAKFAETLRKIIGDQPQTFESNTIKVTVSIGVAEIEDGIDAPDQLIGLADRRLYLAKERGRNCVISSG